VKYRLRVSLERAIDDHRRSRAAIELDSSDDRSTPLGRLYVTASFARAR